METLSRVSYGAALEPFFKFTGVSGVLENKGEKAVKMRLQATTSRRELSWRDFKSNYFRARSCSSADVIRSTAFLTATKGRKGLWIDKRGEEAEAKKGRHKITNDTC